MNALESYYNQLYQSSLAEIQKNNVTIDRQINDPSDKRYGLTLLVRPNEKVKNSIHQMLEALRREEPYQYYYPNTDIHITVLSIISCYAGFELSQVNIQDYTELLKSSLAGISPFDIHFRGITVSPSCIMIQGFPQSKMLHTAREKTRQAFKQSSLQQSIDQRYALRTAHSTVVRFQQPLKDREFFLPLLEHYHNFDFGISPISEMQLVANDWYQKKEKVKLLSTFSLA